MTTLVFGGPRGDPLVRALALAMEASGVPHVVVDLDAREADDDAHERRFQIALDDLGEIPGGLVLGGFSLGARIAARLSVQTNVRGLLSLAYPFHRPGASDERHGLEALSRVTVPTRIIQGTRDNHGTEAEVRGYRLPATAEMVWLEDGNHRFVPRERSGFTEEGHLAAAMAAAVSFVRGR